MATCLKMYRRRRQWLDLPAELVSDIADRLAIIELLSFRSVCKAWNSASLPASTRIESKPDFRPWFLLYQQNSDQCHLLEPQSGQKFTLHLPQLHGTTCLASNQGWLLLFQLGGSMFFFRPFSGAKIYLPKFPASEISDHVAAFSSDPTSQDCVACVVSRRKEPDAGLEAYVLRRGAREWSQHKYHRSIGAIKCAGYHKGEFYFFDAQDELLALRMSDFKWTRYVVVHCSSKEPLPDHFYCPHTYFCGKDMKKLGLLEEEDVSVSIVGTQMQFGGLSKFVFNQTFTSNGGRGGAADEGERESKCRREFKGVWIYPKFYRSSPKDDIW